MVPNVGACFRSRSGFDPGEAVAAELAMMGSVASHHHVLLPGVTEERITFDRQPLDVGG